MPDGRSFLRIGATQGTNINFHVEVKTYQTSYRTKSLKGNKTAASIKHNLQR